MYIYILIYYFACAIERKLFYGFAPALVQIFRFYVSLCVCVCVIEWLARCSYQCSLKGFMQISI